MTFKVPTDEIVAAYRETGSVWKAGRKLGIAGQTVHDRLRAIGHPLSARRWTSDEIDELQRLLETGMPLGEAARRLGRSFSGVASKASTLGLKVKRNRVVTLPRGAGFDKVSIRRHLAALERYDGPVSRYCRAHGLHVDPFVKACERHFPDRWRAYVQAHSDLPQRQCDYCGEPFVPNSGRQQFCTRKCAADARADRSYFGGRRREAVGMAAGVCQLCGREGHKGLSAHHVLGKDNDPDNEVLVALCPGCHKTVTLLGSRKFVDDPVAWETLISLAWLRRHAAELPADCDTLHVTVEIETYADSESDDQAA